MINVKIFDVEFQILSMAALSKTSLNTVEVQFVRPRRC